MNTQDRPRRVPGVGAAVGDAGGGAVDATDDLPNVAAAVAAGEAAPDPNITLVPTAIAVAEAPTLDPRLQKLVAIRRSGGTTAATASTVPGEVAVLARVSDVAAWEALSEVRPGVALPANQDSDGAIVTGRIPLARIEAVRRQPFVLSLKAAQDLRPALSASVPQARGDPASLGGGLSTRGGAGAVVGIIDYGCDFAHLNFRSANGSRIEAIWHQGGVNSPTAPFGYGALYERAAIEAALRQQTPYTTLGYGPARDSAGSQAPTVPTSWTSPPEAAGARALPASLRKRRSSSSTSRLTISSGKARAWSAPLSAIPSDCSKPSSSSLIGPARDRAWLT